MPASRPTRQSGSLWPVGGSGIGGLPMIQDTCKALAEGGPRKISPFFIPGSIINMISGLVSIEYGFQGPEPRGGHRLQHGQPLDRRACARSSTATPT